MTQIIWDEPTTEPLSENVKSILQSTFDSPAITSGILGNIDVETGGTYDFTQKQKTSKKDIFGPGRGLFQMEGGMLKAYDAILAKTNFPDSAKS